MTPPVPPSSATTDAGVFPSDLSRRSILLGHDWLTGMRGGERVLETLCGVFPNAPIHTLLHYPDVISSAINQHPIHTSWLQKIPGMRRHYRSFLPVFPFVVGQFRLPPADLLLTSSHCVAKSLRPAHGTPHLCYCFTPMRYAWTFFEEYFGSKPLRALAVRPLLAWLRHWDRATAQRVTRFVAISRHVQDRIRQFYGRESDVVYPPVDTDRCTPGSTAGTRDFDLIVSALVPYKRIELAVSAYSKSGFPLRIVGVGSERARLESRAGPNVRFLDWQPDDRVLDLYRNCRLLVFPGEEDFGIVPLEAQACGKPVVAFGRGGALETVRDTITGRFFTEPTEPALRDAVEQAATQSWDPAVIRTHARQFGTASFLRGMADCIRRCLA